MFHVLFFWVEPSNMLEALDKKVQCRFFTQAVAPFIALGLFLLVKEVKNNA